MADLDRSKLTDHILHLGACLHKMRHVGPLNEWLQLDLTLPQIKTLIILLGRLPIRMSTLSNLLGTNLSTMTGIVDRLIERGLVERRSAADDRRIVLVCLSALGHEEIARITTLGQAHIHALLKHIPTSDLPVIPHAMDIMLRAAQELETVSGEPSWPDTLSADDTGTLADAERELDHINQA